VTGSVAVLSVPPAGRSLFGMSVVTDQGVVVGHGSIQMGAAPFSALGQHRTV
jgi:hypothetical protein